jgi:hypothetical protein
MAMMITYLCMTYDKKKLSNEKEEIELIIYVSCQLTLKYISRHEDVFIYINITKSYTCELIKDTKICVNHDGS